MWIFLGEVGALDDPCQPGHICVADCGVAQVESTTALVEVRAELDYHNIAEGMNHGARAGLKAVLSEQTPQEQKSILELTKGRTYLAPLLPSSLSSR